MNPRTAAIACTLVLLAGSATATRAATLEVPRQHKTIQAALDAAHPGDVVLVSPGTYRERVRVGPGVTLRSAGDNRKGKRGLRRAEVTILDGGGDKGKAPGVTLAEEATLDGFTVTRVGLYDDERWNRHYKSRGEELGDEEGVAGAEGSAAGISVSSTDCLVANNLVHHNGGVGIAVVGVKGKKGCPRILDNDVQRNMGGGIGLAHVAEAIVRGNVCTENLRAGIGCRDSSPLIVGNECRGNVRAGIGCREGSRPIIRGNRCRANRRAGIGIRMKGTAPVVEDNECIENHMAGIGCRDGASPIIRNNRCSKNKMAGIGCRDGARPIIQGNECRENAMAGIGVRSKAEALVRDNKCIENKLVGIGVIEGARAHVRGNEIVRTGGVPPLIAVKGSTATIEDNDLHGGGVAAILVQGKARIDGNRLHGKGKGQGTAVWVWEGASVLMIDNRIDGYRRALDARKADVTATGNVTTRFEGTALIVREAPTPAHVFGNTAISTDPKAKAVLVEGRKGIVDHNEVKPLEEKGPKGKGTP
jgi:parallel beta-helix repeat protein